MHSDPSSFCGWIRSLERKEQVDLPQSEKQQDGCHQLGQRLPLFNHLKPTKQQPPSLETEAIVKVSIPGLPAVLGL